MKIVQHLETAKDKEENILLQSRYAQQVIQKNQISSMPEFVAGADVCYGSRGKKAYAAAVVVEMSTGNIVEEATWVGIPTYPYKPGFLALREAPCLLNVFENLKTTPDLILIDGNGILHPRRFGLACHIGLSLDIPTIGCAKSLLLGWHRPVSKRNGTPNVEYQGERLGFAIKYERMMMYVSVGHKTDLNFAKKFLPHFAECPIPIEYAHNICSALYRKDENNLPDPKEKIKSIVIKLAQELRKEGLSYKQIACKINENDQVKKLSNKKYTQRKIRNWLEEFLFFAPKE